MQAFTKRNVKEILRDPLTLGFGIGFPVVLLLLLSAIQANVPVEIFNIESLTPGIIVFGFSFIALFSATLISKDRSTSFMTRLYASPLKASEFIFAYTLPQLPMALGQMAVCFACAFILGLKPSAGVLLCMAVSLPSAWLFIGLGLLCGSLLNDKQVGGICGALLTNLSAWLSGTWFDLDLVGGTFKKIAEIFPFCHAVEAGRAALALNFSGIFPDLWWVAAYALAINILAVWVFTKKMHS